MGDATSIVVPVGGTLEIAFLILEAGLAASVQGAQDDKLEAEFLINLTLDAHSPYEVGAAGGGRLVAPVAGGTFEGPRLKGTIIGPSIWPKPLLESGTPR